MKKLFPYLVIIVFAIGCTTDADNPFDDPDNLPPEDTTAFQDLDPTSFVGLHQNIFKPTCANSGCHDGTFEPDFRTIESAYNTLVYHSVVKNDPNNSYQYRVKPGSIAESIMWLRLTEDIDGISGIMPLDAFYDPESEWNENKDEHMSNINDWIMNGALDMFGNAPNVNDQQPGIGGIYAEADGQPLDALERIDVPVGSQQVSVWFALNDKETSAANLQNARVKMSGLIDIEDDTIATEFPLQVLGAPESYPSFLNEPTDFQHKFSFSTSAYPQDSIYYLRVYVKDPMQADTTEIPQDGSQFYIKKLFSWHYVD